jgi:hypothetical protein
MRVFQICSGKRMKVSTAWASGAGGSWDQIPPSLELKGHLGRACGRRKACVRITDRGEENGQKHSLLLIFAFSK